MRCAYAGKYRTQKGIWPLKSGRAYFTPALAGRYEQKLSAREHRSLRGLIGSMCLLNRPQYRVRSRGVAPPWGSRCLVRSSPIQHHHPCVRGHRPFRLLAEISFRLTGGNSFKHRDQACPAASEAHRKSSPLIHIRCRITASFRATATRARAIPRRLATFMPQARSTDHLVLRISSEWAAS